MITLFLLLQGKQRQPSKWIRWLSMLYGDLKDSLRVVTLILNTLTHYESTDWDGFESRLKSFRSYMVNVHNTILKDLIRIDGI